jgi:hypothetical protein
MPHKIEHSMTSSLDPVQTNETRKYWVAQGLGTQHLDQLVAADALIVPEKDFREGVPFVFHQDTTILYKYLAEQLQGQIDIEICVSDDEYVEISLHSATFRISKIVMSYVAAPLIVGLLTNYLYDVLKAKPTDTVEVSLVVENHQCRGFRFDFKGEARDFHLLSDKVNELARDCIAGSGKARKSKK